MLGVHRSVQVVWMVINWLQAVGSTCSQPNCLRVELDSHADMCVVGQHALVLQEHPKVVMVSGFDPLQPLCQEKVVDAAMRYTSHDTGDHLILMIDQAIYVPEVDHCLLCPIQCWINWVEINKVPKFFTHDPTASTHSIQIANPTDNIHPYIIPLQPPHFC